MIASTKDALLILLALAAILGCGFGMGRLASPATAGADGPPATTFEALETETLLSLRNTLDLTPEQTALIAPEVRAASHEILATRERALLDFHLEMLRLHDRLAPHLNPRQQEILRENREKLQDTIDQRFPPLLESSPSATPGGGSEPTPTR